MNEPVIIGNATLYLGDCREILPTLQKVDAVITDTMAHEQSTGRERSKERTGGGALGAKASGDRAPLPSGRTIAGCAGEPLRDHASGDVQMAEAPRHQGEVSRSEGAGERALCSRTGEHALPKDGEEERLRGVRHGGEPLRASQERKPSGQRQGELGSALLALPQQAPQKRVVEKETPRIAIVTDPPYGVDIAGWDKELPPQFVLSECLRIADGPVLWFGTASPRRLLDFRLYDPIPDRCVVWHLPFSLSMTAAHGMFYRWHPIWLWANGGKLSIERDVIEIPADGHNGWKHPGTKPIKLMVRLVDGIESETILDPFMGSGTTGVACANLGRKFIGIEIEPKYFEISCDRIENAQRQARMFA